MKKTGKNHLRPYVHYSTASTAPNFKRPEIRSILLWKYAVPNFSQTGPKTYKTNAKGNLCRYMKCCFCCAISIPAASFSSGGQVYCPVPIQN